MSELLNFKGRLNASEIPVLRISDVGQIFWEPLEALVLNIFKFFISRELKSPLHKNLQILPQQWAF